MNEPKELVERALALANHAVNSLKGGNIQAALELYESALLFVPAALELRFGKAVCLARLGSTKEALSLLEEIVRQEPGFEPARNLHGVLSNGVVNSTSTDSTLPKLLAQDSSTCDSRIPASRYSDGKQNPAVSVLSNVRIVNPNSILITCKDELILESSVYNDLRNLVPLNIPAHSDVHETRNGEYMVLSGFWSGGFFHWILEWLPKVLIAESVGFKGKYVIPKGGRFIRESIEMLDIPPSRIMDQPIEPWVAENLFIADSIHSSEIELYPALFNELRMRLIEKSVAPKKSVQKLYLRRTNPNRPRRVTNENDLVTILNQYQFDCLDLESLSLKEQIGITSKVSLLLGPHGAGMIHTLFMPPKSSVVELFAPTYINVAILPLLNFMAHRYYMIPSYLNCAEYAYGQDIEAFLEVVKHTLKSELGGYP